MAFRGQHETGGGAGSEGAQQASADCWRCRGAAEAPERAPGRQGALTALGMCMPSARRPQQRARAAISDRQPRQGLPLVAMPRPLASSQESHLCRQIAGLLCS